MGLLWARRRVCVCVAAFVSNYTNINHRLTFTTRTHTQRATTAVVGSKKALQEANEKLPADQKMDIVDLL
jgi:hypothetical protein